MVISPLFLMLAREVAQKACQLANLSDNGAYPVIYKNAQGLYQKDLENLEHLWASNKVGGYENYTALELLDPYVINTQILETFPSNIKDAILALRRSKKTAREQIAAQIKEYEEALDTIFEDIKKNKLENETIEAFLKKSIAEQNIINYIQKCFAASLIKPASKHHENKLPKIDKYETAANIYFGVYASAYTTVMFTDKILLARFGDIFFLTQPVGVAIVSVAIVNIILDQYLFDQLEKLLNYLGVLEYFNKKTLTLEDRENIKFFMFAVVALTTGLMGYYLIPAALLLFTTGYFVNSMLQMNQLADTINKFFFTKDKQGVNRFLLGYTRFEYMDRNGQLKMAEFTSTQWGILCSGIVLSCFYAVTMAALVAKWIYPLSEGLATGMAIFGLTSNPLGILFCVTLIPYAIIYGLLLAKRWAELIQLDVVLKKNYNGNGIFSSVALSIFFGNVINGISHYWVNVGEKFKKFGNDFMLMFNDNQSTSDQATTDVLYALGAFVLGVIELLLKFIRVVISMLLLYGIYYMLNDVYAAISEIINPKAAQALLWVNFSAQIPFSTKSMAREMLPDEKADTMHLSAWAQLRVIFYGAMNAMRSALVPNGGELATKPEENLLNASSAGTSYALGGSLAAQNYNKAVGEERQKTKPQMTTSTLVLYGQKQREAKSQNGTVTLKAYFAPQLKV